VPGQRRQQLERFDRHLLATQAGNQFFRLRLEHDRLCGQVMDTLERIRLAGDQDLGLVYPAKHSVTYRACLTPRDTQTLKPLS